MKLSAPLAVAAHLAATITASNEFWMSFEVGWFTKEGAKFTHAAPQCTRELKETPLFIFVDDVSGDKIGVRMETQYLDPDIIEWNTGDDYLGHHSKCQYARTTSLLLYLPTKQMIQPRDRSKQTDSCIAVYKDRDYKIFDLEDRVVGQCVLDTSHSIGCWYGTGEAKNDYSIIKCTSETLKLPNPW